MVNQTPVEAAYQKPGEKSSDIWGRCASIGLFVILALFLMTLSGDAKAAPEGNNSDQLRSGQAHLPTKSATKTPNHIAYNPSHHAGGIGDVVSQNDTYGGATPGLRGGETEEDMNNVVDVALDDIEKASDDEAKKEKGILSSAISAMSSGIRNGLASMLGMSSDSEEVKDIAKEIEDKVEEDAQKEFDEETDEIKEDAVDAVEVRVELEEEEGTSFEKIEKDVLNSETNAITDVRQEVDDAEKRIEDNLRMKAAMAEKEIMEKRLSAKLGKPVKLEIVGDEVRGVKAALDSARSQSQQGYPQGQWGGGGQQQFGGQPQQGYPQGQWGGGGQQQFGGQPQQGFPQGQWGGGGGSQQPYFANNQQLYQGPGQGAQYQPPPNNFQPPPAGVGAGSGAGSGAGAGSGTGSGSGTGGGEGGATLGGN